MKKRGSGVLLHVTSLDSRYGIGDMGPAAYSFADSLSDAEQSFWQILPLSPTEPRHANSPYYSTSAFAGNPILVSPEKLVEEGLLSKNDIKPLLSNSRKDHVEYDKVFQSVNGFPEIVNEFVFIRQVAVDAVFSPV